MPASRIARHLRVELPLDLGRRRPAPSTQAAMKSWPRGQNAPSGASSDRTLSAGETGRPPQSAR